MAFHQMEKKVMICREIWNSEEKENVERNNEGRPSLKQNTPSGSFCSILCDQLLIKSPLKKPERGFLRGHEAVIKNLALSLSEQAI